MKNHDPVPLDDIDRRIITLLQPDGRRAFTQVADELGVSEGLVRYRYRRLVDSGIMQVVGIADPLKIGFKLMVMVSVRVRAGRQENVTAALSLLPEASYVAAVASRGVDVLVELVCRDSEHFRQVLHEKVHPIDGVLETDTAIILEISKMAYGWGVPEIADGEPTGESTTDPEG
jgi:Lrp/AsnC family transcriptional regulator, regulator for asnA, asnC and gidA